MIKRPKKTQRKQRQKLLNLRKKKQRKPLLKLQRQKLRPQRLRQKNQQKLQRQQKHPQNNPKNTTTKYRGVFLSAFSDISIEQTQNKAIFPSSLIRQSRNANSAKSA